MLRKFIIYIVAVSVLACFSDRLHAQAETANDLQARLDRYCTEKSQDAVDPKDKFVRLEAFYSFKINTCVQVEVSDTEKNWSYTLQDITFGFFHAPKLVKSDMPLRVYVHEYGEFGSASAEGFWKSTDSSSDKQLASEIAASIKCDRSEQICHESDATVFIGLIEPESHEYRISNWTTDGIVADDVDEGTCGIGHRLSIDFKNNSVVVTDYPKKISANDDSCKGFQSANSYSLHGGVLGFMAQSQIFSCAADGATSAILAKVKEYKGDVEDKTYALWLDDGEGGPPATNKTPKHPYTRSDCQRLMDKKLKELKEQ